MRKARSLIGLKVVAQAGGEALGTVRDLIFDSQSSELLAVVLSDKDLFGLIQAQVVPWREVVTIGRDAIIVNSAASKIKAGSDERLSEVVQRETTLGGTRLMTTDGHELGTLADVYIDETSGRVSGYELSGGFISDTLRGKRFLPAVENVQIGKDVAFVPPEVTGQIEQRAWQPGSWQHTTVSASERFSHLAGTARSKAESLYENVATSSADKQESWLIGRISSRDVPFPGSGPAGSELEGANPDYLVRAGEIITPEAARKARELGLLGNLTSAVVENMATGAYNSGKEKLMGPSPAATTSYDTVETVGSNSEATPTTTPNPLASVQNRAASAAIGKPAGRPVLRPDGSTLIATGEIITEIVLTEARAVGKENEVIAAAGIGAAQVGLESAKEQAATLWSTLKGRAEEFSGQMQVKRSESEEAALQKRIVEAAGQRASRLILDRNDQPIVAPGEIITHAAIERAREAGALELLLNSVEGETQTVMPPPPIVVEEVRELKEAEVVPTSEVHEVEPVGSASRTPLV